MTKKKVAQWWRGEIRLSEVNWVKIATKKARSADKKGSLYKEGNILTYLHENWVDFVPKVTEMHEDGFSYERIEWNHFIDVYDSSSLQQKKSLLLKLLDCCYKLDVVWILHWELLRPFTNVLVTEDMEVYIIDFERGKKIAESRKNMKHLMQWLISQWYVSVEKVRKLSHLSQEELYSTLSDIILQVTPNKFLKVQWESFWVESIQSLFTDGLSESWIYWLWNTLRFLVINMLIIWVDQFTKSYFVDLAYNQQSNRITPSHNTWIAWSIQVSKKVIIRVSVVFLIWIYWYRLTETKLHKKKRMNGRDVFFFKVWVVSLLSWWIWNLIDRISHWYVRDFIDISPLITFYDRPIFNIADIFIVMWWISILIYERRKS